MTNEKNLAVEVQKIRCPHLNREFRNHGSAGAVEVFVRFENSCPTDIMGCPEYYEGTGGCGLRVVNSGDTRSCYLPCRYSGWNSLLAKG